MITRAARVVALALTLVGAPGCYWSTPPSAPHRAQSTADVDRVADLGPPAPRPLTGAHAIVLGRFDTVAPNPIGGVYDHHEYGVAPLARTYFHRDAAVDLFEETSDALRASGLEVLKDYAGGAQSALLEAPLRARDPRLVRGTLVSLQHDRLRTVDARDFDVVRLAVDVRVTDANGAPLLARTYTIEGKLPFDEHSDVLALLGWRLADALTADPDFIAAIAAEARPS